MLEAIERLARDQNDGATVRLTLERRLSRTADPAHARGAARAARQRVCLAALGSASAPRKPGSKARRSPSGLPAELERARRLYERVLSVDAGSAQAAGRLVELSAQAGDWEQVREAFEVVLPTLEERHLVTLLLGLEERAESTGAAPAYVELVDLGLARGLHRGPGAAPGPGQGARARRALPAAPTKPPSCSERWCKRPATTPRTSSSRSPSFCSAPSTAQQRVDDYRWMMAESVKRARSPVELWLKWAEVEEQRFQEPERAVRLAGASRGRRSRAHRRAVRAVAAARRRR